MDNANKIEIYQSEDGDSRVELKLKSESFWLSQKQMGILFDRDTDTIGLHLRNIYKEQELDMSATTEESSVVQQEGKRRVKRKVKLYNLDAIISVGYRVNSKKGTEFRIWATKRLKELLLQGFSINRQRFEQNANELQQALKLIEKTSSSANLTVDLGRGLTELVSRYTQTFLWLQRYDEGLLDEPLGENGGSLISLNMATELLGEFKRSLMEKGEATHLFANPIGDGLAGILGNLQQTVLGEPAYPSIESKAAHLLYFVVKNHPFSDGNKRSGAFLFIDFLSRNNRLINSNGYPVINDSGLAALTLLVAESEPKQKKILINLIMHMLKTSN